MSTYLLYLQCVEPYIFLGDTFSGLGAISEGAERAGDVAAVWRASRERVLQRRSPLYARNSGEQKLYPREISLRSP